MSTSPETPPDPTKSWTRRTLRFARRCLIYYLGFVLLLSFLQRRLMYVPTTVPSLPVEKAGRGLGTARDISFATSDGLQIHGWHLLPANMRLIEPAEFDRALTDPHRLVVLFFAGNGGNRLHRADDFKILNQLEAHVIAFDYRGYGENAGMPSAQAFAADALAAWQYLTVTKGVSPRRIVIYGESLGGGVATRLAAELCQQKTPPAGMILCSTFSSMVDAASYHYPWLPVSLVLKDRYRSDLWITSVTAPLLMLHGQRDRIVPYNLGRRLFEKAPEKSASGVAKQFVDLPRADHNDILLTDEARYQAGISQFLKQLEPKAPQLPTH